MTEADPVGVGFPMLDITEQPGNVLELRMSGTLRGRDYDALTPRVEDAISHHDHVNVVCAFDDVHRVTPSAAWQDTKMVKHLGHFGRVAIVGDKRRARAIAWASKLVAKRARHFPSARRTEALLWARDPPSR